MMVCTSPFRLRGDGRLYRHFDLTENKIVHSKYIIVPCGQCMACRINRSNEWSDRISHELALYNTACFATITYDDPHLPPNASLSKRDIQLWLKLLRKHLKKTIKYYICGEYGGTTFRPHYHGIFINISPHEMKTLGKRLWNKCDPQQFRVSMAVPETINYTTKYIQKTALGESAKSSYDANNLERPFALMSKGIGKSYMQNSINRKKISDQLCIITSSGARHPLPKYYKKLLWLGPEEYPYQTRGELEEIAKKRVSGKETERILAKKVSLKKDKL